MGSGYILGDETDSVGVLSGGLATETDSVGIPASGGIATVTDIMGRLAPGRSLYTEYTVYRYKYIHILRHQHLFGCLVFSYRIH